MDIQPPRPDYPKAVDLSTCRTCSARLHLTNPRMTPTCRTISPRVGVSGQGCDKRRGSGVPSLHVGATNTHKPFVANRRWRVVQDAGQKSGGDSHGLGETKAEVRGPAVDFLLACM